MSSIQPPKRFRLGDTTQSKIAAKATQGEWSTSGPDTIAEWVIYDSQWAIAETRSYDHNEPMSNRPGATGPAYIDANANAEHIVRLHNRQPLYDALVDAVKAWKNVRSGQAQRELWDALAALEREKP